MSEKDKSGDMSKANSGPTKLFMLAVLDLTWQMVVVVLVPIVGGHELDKHFKTTPYITIVGFILAMAGSYVVIKRVFDSYNKQSLNGTKGK